MPWCPNCKAEFVDGIKECNDCEILLVDKLEEEPSNKTQDEYINDKEAFLITVGNAIEAGLIESKLAQAGIPVLKKFDNMGGYIGGFSSLDYQIFVPFKLLKLAKEILRQDDEDTNK
ncbi:MAG: DUF2007 domain-containing protein [Clostridiales bacterium]